MLASVKDGLYHPMLPTFRRMDMDTAMHKLPEEHSRTTTPLTRGNNLHHDLATCRYRDDKLLWLETVYKFRLVFFFQAISRVAQSLCSDQLTGRCQAR